MLDKGGHCCWIAPSWTAGARAAARRSNRTGGDGGAAWSGHAAERGGLVSFLVRDPRYLGIGGKWSRW